MRWIPFEPDVFTNDDEPDRVEEVAQLDGHRGGVEHPGGRPGIEIEDDGVGHVGGRGPGLEGVELERGEVRQPDERGGLVDVALVELADLGHPVGVVRRAALLEEPLALHPVRAPHERDGSAGEVGDHHRGDPGVVVDDLGLGEPRLGVQDLLEVREHEAAAVDVDVGARGRPGDGTAFPGGHL